MMDIEAVKITQYQVKCANHGTNKILISMTTHYLHSALMELTIFVETLTKDKKQFGATQMIQVLLGKNVYLLATLS